MTTERNVIITRQPMTNLVGAMKFWTGKRWSFEYPNGDCQLIADYGLDTQVKL